MSGLAGQRILLGVTGGIAAYKAADLARRLQDAGAEVQVVMTEGAQQFVTPLTFQALTGQPGAHQRCGTPPPKPRWAISNWRAGPTASWSRRPAPMSSRGSPHGLADDLLDHALPGQRGAAGARPGDEPRDVGASPRPRPMSPLLRARGVAMLGPGEGDQACGEVGAGRMLEPLQIVAALRRRAPRRAAGRPADRWSAPARPTRTSTRCVTSATAAPAGWASRSPRKPRAMGAEVTLVAGPVTLRHAGRRAPRRRAPRARRCATPCSPRCPARTSTSAPPPSPTTCRPQTAAAEDQEGRATRCQLELVRTPDILAEVAAHAARPRWWSASPPRPSDSRRTRGPSCAPSTST